MGSLRRILGKRESATTPDFRKIISEAERQSKEYQEKAAPFHRIAYAIIHAAAECVRRIDAMIGGDNERGMIIDRVES
jgi:hypothetical protein